MDMSVTQNETADSRKLLYAHMLVYVSIRHSVEHCPFIHANILIRISGTIVPHIALSSLPLVSLFASLILLFSFRDFISCGQPICGEYVSMCQRTLDVCK